MSFKLITTFLIILGLANTSAFAGELKIGQSEVVCISDDVGGGGKPGDALKRLNEILSKDEINIGSLIKSPFATSSPSVGTVWFKDYPSGMQYCVTITKQ